MFTLSASKAHTHTYKTLTFILPTRFYTCWTLYIRTTSTSTLWLKSRYPLFISIRSISTTLIIIPLLELWFTLNLKSAFKWIVILYSCPALFSTNLPKLFFLNLFGMNHKPWNVHSWNKNSKRTLVYHKERYPMTYLLLLAYESSPKVQAYIDN